MEETFEFLKEKTKVNYIATINGDKPSNRPFGDPVLFDNKIFKCYIYQMLNQQFTMRMEIFLVLIDFRNRKNYRERNYHAVRKTRAGIRNKNTKTSICTLWRRNISS